MIPRLYLFFRGHLSEEGAKGQIGVCLQWHLTLVDLTTQLYLGLLYNKLASS